MAPAGLSLRDVHLRRSQTPFGKVGSVAALLAATSHTNKRCGKSARKRALAIRILRIGSLQSIWGTLLSVPQLRSFRRHAQQPKDESTASVTFETSPLWQGMPRPGCSAVLQALHPPNWQVRSGQRTGRAVGGLATLARTCTQDASEVTDNGSEHHVAA